MAFEDIFKDIDNLDDIDEPNNQADDSDLVWDTGQEEKFWRAVDPNDVWSVDGGKNCGNCSGGSCSDEDCDCDGECDNESVQGSILDFEEVDESDDALDESDDALDEYGDINDDPDDEPDTNSGGGSFDDIL